MKLIQAKALIDCNHHLIGDIYKGYKISAIVVVPRFANLLAGIANYILNNMNYGHLLQGHEEFNVVALLDLDRYPITGHLIWRDLGYILDNPENVN